MVSFPRPRRFRRRGAGPGGSRPSDETATVSGGDLVPMANGQSIARTERALKMLAAQSSQLHGQVVQLEQRVDALSDALLDRLDVPSNDDLLEARMQTSRVGAELSRLEVNLAARLDAVRAELRLLQGHDDAVDLRELAPTDTGWPPVRSTPS